MLRVTRLRDPTGAYYLADLRADSVEFALFGEDVSAWVGSGSGDLGLFGKVSPESFARLLSGRHPRVDLALTGTRRSVCGFDLTFCAPKSVSVLFGVGSRSVSEEVLKAHRSAVGHAVDYVERRGLAVRRGSRDERTLLGADGVVGASFTHGASRALDPHLHSHVVLANLARGEDSRWSSIDARGLYAHASAADGLYFAHLRDRLSTELGVIWAQDQNGRIDIRGIDPLVLGAFSNRQAEIREHLSERGSLVSSRRARDVAALATRDPKERGLTVKQLHDIWSNKASSVGFDRNELEVTLELDGSDRRPDQGLSGSIPVDEHRYASLLVVSPHATATRRDVVKAWSNSILQGASAADVESCVDLIAHENVAEPGVAETRRALSTLLPSNDAIRVLGPRPIGVDQHRLWRRTAESIDAYRRRWEVNDHLIGFEVGESGPEIAKFPIKRLADHIELRRAVDETRRDLGRDVSRDRSAPSLSAGRDHSR